MDDVAAVDELERLRDLAADLADHGLGLRTFDFEAALQTAAGQEFLHDVQVTMVRKAGQNIAPTGDTVLSAGDAVLVVAESQDAIANAAAALRASAEKLPDILAITGRADSCLLLCGTNLTEAMLDAAVRALELTPWLTGNYRARALELRRRVRARS